MNSDFFSVSILVVLKNHIGNLRGKDKTDDKTVMYGKFNAFAIACKLMKIPDITIDNIPVVRYNAFKAKIMVSTFQNNSASTMLSKLEYQVIRLLCKITSPELLLLMFIQFMRAKATGYVKTS